ncbi:AMP-binding protein [Rhizobium sp. ARZ01]|uniref:AMP-binding protein n=1 Tax=Rhizobium sp. ARZ01 TaxID=2769313 RepID=UPI001785E67D|nr:AMP-binding protein [Rhizobium sp. ARZ01]MBD9372991.1 AMP-binding protein [Rhizobium sp. ARZ01]
MFQKFVPAFAARGAAPALIFPGRPAITYTELANAIALRMRQFGADKKVIAIEAEHSEHAIVSYLAALEMGHAVAMLPPATCSLSEEFSLAFEPDLCCRRVGERWTVVEALPQPRVAHRELHPDLALLLLTSGSTGGAKAVRLSRANIDANAASIAQYLGLSSTDRACLVLPLHYSYGLSVLHSHLAVGASLYFPQRSILSEGFLDELAVQECTNFPGVPYSYELLESVGFRERSFPKLRLMTVAGGRLPPDTVRLYNRYMRAQDGVFFVMYGQTEATARIAYVPPALLEGNEDCIGIAVPDGSLSLENAEGEEIRQPGKVGELVYRGPNVMLGYAAGREDLAEGATVGALRTGDLAAIDESGLFRIVGRTKRISKVAGRRIGHDRLEEALERRGIRAAVVGDDEAVHAFYCGGQAEGEVREVLAVVAGLTLLQVGVTRIEALPRLTSGKIDYAGLQARFKAGQKKVDRRAVGVREAFDQVFYPKTAGVRDSFVTLGGDSLRFVQLSLALERIVGELPAEWETKTVAQLSDLKPAAQVKPVTGVDLLIRALAILLVVVQHQTLWPIPGGSAAMIVLIGFGLARFQSGALMAGDVMRVLRPALQVLIPYYLIVAAYTVAWEEVPWASLLLLGNFGFADPARHSMVPYLYWFIEAYCQMLLVVAGLFCLPAVRRFAEPDPFVAGLSFLALALCARIVIPPLLDMGNRQIFTLPWIFYLAALGWSAAFASTTARKLLLLTIGTAVLVFFAFYESVWIGTRVKYLLQIAVLSGLLFCPRVPMPFRLKAIVLPLSAASFHIYILHRFVPELLMAPLGAVLPAGLFSLLATAGGVALGVVVWWLQGRLLSFLARKKGDGILPVLQTYIGVRGQRST